MELKVTVDDEVLKDLAHKQAIITTALNLIPADQFKGIADIDKEDLIDFGAEVAQELLRLRNQGTPALRRDFRH